MKKLIGLIAVFVALTLIFNIPTAEARKRKKTVTSRLVDIQSAASTNANNLRSVATTAANNSRALGEAKTILNALLMRIEEQGFTGATIVDELVRVSDLLAPLVPENELDNPFKLIRDVQQKFKDPDIDFRFSDFIDGAEFKEALKRLKRRREEERSNNFLDKAGQVKDDLAEVIVSVGSLAVRSITEVSGEPTPAEKVADRLDKIPDALFVPLVVIQDLLTELNENLTTAKERYNQLKEYGVFERNFIDDDGPICDLTNVKANIVFRKSLQLKALTLFLKGKAKKIEVIIPDANVDAGIHGYTGTTVNVIKPIKNEAAETVDKLEDISKYMDIISSITARKDRFCNDDESPISVSLREHRMASGF